MKSLDDSKNIIIIDLLSFGFNNEEEISKELVQLNENVVNPIQDLFYEIGGCAKMEPLVVLAISP